MRRRMTCGSLVAATVAFCGFQGASAVTLSPGDLVAVDYFNKSVIKIDLVTGAQELISQGGLIDGPLSVVVDPMGTIYLSNISFGNTRIIKIDPGTGAQSIAVAQGISQIFDMALDRAGNVFSANVFPQYQGGGRIMKVSPVVQHQLPIAGGDKSIAEPRGLAVSPNGEVFVAEASSGKLPGVDVPTRILRIDQSTGTMSVVTSGTTLANFTKLVVAEDGSLLVMAMPTSSTHHIDSIIRVDPSTGNQTVIVEPLLGFSPGQIALEESGSILYAAEDAAIRRVNPTTREITTVTSGGLLRHVTDIAMVPNGFGAIENCAGDTDNNGVINVNDVAATIYQVGNPAAPAAYDTDGSGAVDVHDVTMIIFRLGTVCDPV